MIVNPVAEESEMKVTRVCAGIDWAQDDHAVCLLDQQGAVLERFSVSHSAAGIKKLVGNLVRANACAVGIERSDGPLVAALLEAQLPIFVIAPSQVKNLRSRYGNTGNKDDRFDAYVLADTVRTDHRRLVALTCSTPATQALRASVRARLGLVENRVAIANQLRAHLQVALPGAVGLFSDLDSPISLSFLERFTTQAKTDWLTPIRLAGWLQANSYSGRVDPEVLHTRLSSAPRGITDPAEVQVHATITAAFVAMLRTLRTQIEVLTDAITEQMRHHPQAPVVTSFPRAGTVRAARLLAEIGDATGRFPTPGSLAALGGVAPSTRQSGKVKTVVFRWGADTDLRGALTDFAGDSRRANPWAADLYDQARQRGHDHPHAVRILARAWVPIIWKCLRDNQPYDPARHNALQRLLTQDNAA